MFNRFKKQETRLDVAIDEILTDMANELPESERYADLLTKLERLHKLKTVESPKQSVSPDQILLVAGNLLGILIIVAYEQKHVFASKGQNFIFKPK